MFTSDSGQRGHLVAEWGVTQNLGVKFLAMLAQILAIAVALVSIAFYLAAFFFPESHRKDDFFWSGVGFFYAVILWFAAGRITGVVALAQVTGTLLIFWFGWETFSLRRAVANPQVKTQVSESSVLTSFVSPVFALFRSRKADKTPPAVTEVENEPDTKAAITTAESPTPPATEVAEAAEELATESVSESETLVSSEVESAESDESSETVSDVVEPETNEAAIETEEPATETPEAETIAKSEPQPKSRVGQFLQGFLGKQKSTEKTSKSEDESPAPAVAESDDGGDWLDDILETPPSDELESSPEEDTAEVPLTETDPESPELEKVEAVEAVEAVVAEEDSATETTEDLVDAAVTAELESDEGEDAATDSEETDPETLPAQPALFVPLNSGDADSSEDAVESEEAKDSAEETEDSEKPEV